MTTKFTFGCACRQVTGSFVVPTSKLPLPFSCCHCNTCRHASGQLFVSDLTVSKELAVQIDGHPVANKTSDRLTRYFCGTCGCSIYDYDNYSKAHFVCMGTLDKSEGLVELKKHIFVDDTKDGGASHWLKATYWAGEDEVSKKLDGPPSNDIASTAEEGKSALLCHCQCRGVQFLLTRPNQTSSNVYSPLPDLLVPYHLHSCQKPYDFKWWLRRGGTRYLAGTCACNSCRLSAGYDVQAWVFVPKSNILQADRSPLDFAMGTLKQYSHTNGAYREFCRRCGATVFWHCDERPGIIDVSVGLLDSPRGALAEDWIDWTTDRVSFEEYASNKGLISSLSRGLREWGTKQS